MTNSVITFYFCIAGLISTSAALSHCRDGFKNQCRARICAAHVTLDPKVSRFIRWGNILHICYCARHFVCYICNYHVSFLHNPRCWSRWLIVLLSMKICMHCLSFGLLYFVFDFLRCSYCVSCTVLFVDISQVIGGEDHLWNDFTSVVSVGVLNCISTWNFVSFHLLSKSNSHKYQCRCISSSVKY